MIHGRLCREALKVSSGRQRRVARLHAGAALAFAVPTAVAQRRLSTTPAKLPLDVIVLPLTSPVAAGATSAITAVPC